MSSPVRLGEPATTETTVTDNGDGTTTTTIRDIPAKPYELVWWNATNCGEEIDKLAGQTPFDYIERHAWNSDKTDVLHYFDMGYPRLGVQKPDLLFNEENILEVVPIQEDEDSYASAVLVVGAGEGAEVGGGQELRCDVGAVERRVGGVIGGGAVVLDEADEPGVFHSVVLRRTGWR